MKVTNKRFYLEFIKFRDHSSSAGWVDYADLDTKDCCEIKVVGFVLHEDKKQVILGNFADDTHCHARHRIMKGTIIKRKRLTV